MILKPISAPQAEPVTIADVEAQCRATITGDTAQTALVNAYISACRAKAENATSRALVTQTWELVMDCFPLRSLLFGKPIELPLPPLQSVTSITYYDINGDLQTLAASEYTVDTDSTPGRVYPAHDKVWPDTLDIKSAVRIRFVCGHATPFTAVNGTETLTALGRTFANNDIVRVTNIGGALPTGLAVNTDYHVVNASGAAFQLSLTEGGAAINITSDGTGTQFVGEVPAAIRTWMLVNVANLYENRESIVLGVSTADLRTLADSLLDPVTWEVRL